MIPELLFVTYIRIFFGHCHVAFYGILSVFGHCHVTFPYVEPLSFFGTFVQKFKKSCSLTFLLPIFFRSFQMAAIMSQTNASFSTKISEKSLFISAISYEKYIVCKDYCIAHHDDETCFLPACKYHIMLRGNVEELLKMLDTFCFTYQHVDCLYTLFKYRFSGKVIAKSGQVFDNLQPAVDFNHKNKGVDRVPSIAKKRLVRKKFKTIYSAPLKRETNADQWISIWRKS